MVPPYHLLDEFYQNKTGPLGAAWLVCQIAFSALMNGQLFRRMIVPQSLEFNADSKLIPHRSLMVLAATIERMPYGLRMYSAGARFLTAVSIR